MFPIFFYCWREKNFSITREGVEKARFSRKDGFDQYRCSPISMKSLFPKLNEMNCDLFFLQILRNFDAQCDGIFESENYNIKY